MAAGLFPTESELDQLILGPDSVAWRIASDVRLNMVMLRNRSEKIRRGPLGAEA